MINFSQPSITKREIKNVEKVLQSGWLTTGSWTNLFADKINGYIGSKYCVPVSSCTAALHLALICAGIKPGDEVITTPFTFVSTINVIIHLGAKPVFVDIKANDFIIDEKKIEEKITKKTKAILVVHYAGFCADLDYLRRLCKKYKLKLIEDAAHAFGSKYKKEFIGQKSEFCAFSFYPTKNITTGEGGALVTNNKKVYERAKILSLHGINKDGWKRYSSFGTWQYDVVEFGYKYNLTNIASAIGIAQIERIKQLQKKREFLYKNYVSLLKNIRGIEILEGNSYSKPFRHLFVIKITDPKIGRNFVIEKLKKENIICSVHFIPVYKFSIYKKTLRISINNFPKTQKAYLQCISLPFSSTIKKKQNAEIISNINTVIKKSR